MPEEMHWNLDDILPLSDFDAFYSEVKMGILELEKGYGALHSEMSREAFKEFLLFKEKIETKVSRLYAMPRLMEDADKTSELAKKLNSKAQAVLMGYEDAAIRIKQWLMGKETDGKGALDDNNAKRLFTAVPTLEHILTSMRNERISSLGGREERIATKKDGILKKALLDLRSEIETKTCYTFKQKGKEERVINTQSEIRALFFSSNPDEREAAHLALMHGLQENLTKYFMIYQAVVKDWGETAKLRGFRTPISMRNFENQVPDEAITTLLDVCADNMGIYQRYFKFKGKKLGMEKLRRFDIYAPLPAEKQRIVPFSEAVTLVLDTFNDFHDGFAEYAKKIIDAQHIDSHPSPVKGGMQFCATVCPEVTPYVMLNYADSLNDITVLAHELGHGIHSLYASHLPKSAQKANLPLSETASTFSEIILFEKLLSTIDDEEEKKAFLSAKIARSYAVIGRQNYFVIFEKRAHEAIMNGSSAEELSEIYFKTLEEQFSDSLEIDPSFKYEWAGITHIAHWPFYCYSYTFGDLLSLALYAQYKDDGKRFIPKMEKILSTGGSRDPLQVLLDVGIDMRSRDFWQGSFNIIQDWQEQLER
ncbi:M3 family oligoendopeptidase [Candidatus Woesearchaeota archaeon]|nr:M3 family oligoendopeptidase [Candidatus Woesearchaeota archaeon]